MVVVWRIEIVLRDGVVWDVVIRGNTLVEKVRCLLWIAVLLTRISVISALLVLFADNSQRLFLHFPRLPFSLNLSHLLQQNFLIPIQNPQFLKILQFLKLLLIPLLPLPIFLNLIDNFSRLQAIEDIFDFKTLSV